VGLSWSERVPDRTTRADRLLAAGLAAAYFVLLAATLDIGFPRDESFYFHAGEQYSRWFDRLIAAPGEAFTKAAVDEDFAYNPEHPALPKILFGLSWRLFGDMHDPTAEPWSRAWYDRGQPPRPILGLLSESTAMRLPALLIASLLVASIYLFGARFLNRRVGLVGALAYALMPHAFWHAHLACFDVPVAALWFLTTYCFFRAERGGGWRWALLTGLAFGLTLSTKHNGWFLLPTLGLYALLVRLRGFGLRRAPAADGGGHGEGPGRAVDLRLPGVPLALLAMVLVGPLVLYALWPKLWFDPLGHFAWYVKRHAQHEYYWAYYFGTLYTHPPFPAAFPWVMSLMTIPGPTLLLAFAGLGRIVRAGVARACRRVAAARASLPPGAPGVLLFLVVNAVVPFLVIGNTRTPIFGGTKHWLPAMPYVALVAGLGFELVLAAIARLGAFVPRLGGRAARAALLGTAALAFVAPAAFDTLHGHTNGSTYYSSLFGGFGAMGRHGMQREFWGNTAFSALPWLNENAPEGARVDFHDTTSEAVRMYKRDGLLRRDIRPVWDWGRADLFLFHWHKEFLDLEADVKEGFGVTLPVYVVAQDGVPLLNVYERPPRAPVPGRPR